METWKRRMQRSTYFSEVGQKMEGAEHNIRIKIKINIFSYPIFFYVTKFVIFFIFSFFEPFCFEVLA